MPPDDIKLSKLEPADNGQMGFDLRWLERHDRPPGEEPPRGLNLCAGISDEHVELLRLSKTGIHVAAHLTELPPRELRARKLHEAVRVARSRLSSRAEPKEAKRDGHEED